MMASAVAVATVCTRAKASSSSARDRAIRLAPASTATRDPTEPRRERQPRSLSHGARAPSGTLANGGDSQEEEAGGDQQPAQHVAGEVPAEHEKRGRDRDHVGRSDRGDDNARTRAGATSTAASAIDMALVAWPLGKASAPTWSRSENRVEARVRERHLQPQADQVGARDQPDRRDRLAAAAQAPIPRRTARRA